MDMAEDEGAELSSMDEVVGYIKTLLRKNDTHRFLIGNMDEYVARNILKYTDNKIKKSQDVQPDVQYPFDSEYENKVIGIGVSDSTAHWYSDFAEQHRLPIEQLIERWAVDVLGVLKKYTLTLRNLLKKDAHYDAKVKDRSFDMEAIHRNASMVFTDASVLEEVCHAVGDYRHRSADSKGDFFYRLAQESYDL